MYRSWIRSQSAPLLLILLVLGSPVLAQDELLGDASLDDLTELNLEDLLDVEVTSVSRKAQSLSSAAAAVYVISQEKIRRTGVTNIADALRLVPGVMVSRIDSSKWAVSSRGFNGRFANKLLVMIDGRSVYNSTYSGVYWEDLDLLLEDVDRIEVIRGPGATLWGANAVNGVINIITKHSADTEGWHVKGSAGDYEEGSGELRYGSAIGEHSFARAYAKFSERDSFETLSGDLQEDSWRMRSAGFRVDTQLQAKTSLRISGDINRSKVNQRLIVPQVTPPYFGEANDPSEIESNNINMALVHTLSPESELVLQSYLFKYHRDESIFNDEETTVDLSFQHSYSGWTRQDIVWGLGYRSIDKKLKRTATALKAIDREDSLKSAFFQNQITLVEDTLDLTLGAKIEDYDKGDSELQPSARLFWAINDKQKFWASVSRAARTPALGERYTESLTSVAAPGSIVNPGNVPVLVLVKGSEDFESEITTAYEIGYRLIPRQNLSFDFAVFENHNKNLRSYQSQEVTFEDGNLIQPVVLANQGSILSRGFESSIHWKANSVMDLELGYAFFELDDLTGQQRDYFNGPNPKHMVSLYSSWDITKNVDMDLWYRFMDETVALDPIDSTRAEVDSYSTLDARLAWRPKEHLEVALVGQNLLEDSHQEYMPEVLSFPANVPRSFYVSVQAKFP